MKTYLFLLSLITVILSCSDNENIENKTNQLVDSEIIFKEVKSKEHFIETIKNDSIWLFEVQQKAKERNVPIEEMLILDAEYMVNIDAKIVKIENDIIRDKNWLAVVKKKAEEQNISLEEMIRSDATYIYEESTKQTNDSIIITQPKN